MKSFFIRIIFVSVFFCFANPVFANEKNNEGSIVNSLKNEEVREQAKILYMGNKYEQAKNHIMSIPNTEKVAFDYYLIGLTSTDSTDAVEAYKKALELDGNFYQAYYNIAVIYYEKENYEKAIEYYKLAVSKNKKLEYGYYNLGCCYLKINDYNNARKSFESAIKLNPQEADYYYNLGYAYKKLGNKKRADKAINLYNELMKKRIEN